MKLKSTFKSWSGALLFLAGVLLGLALSASVTWGQMEPGLYTSNNGDEKLKLQCPLILAPTETGVIKANIINLMAEDVTPLVSTEISHVPVSRKSDQTIMLKPRASEMIEWTVDSSDVIFERLILVNVFQYHYRDNPAFFGSCGILLFSLFGMTGMETFSLVFVLSILAMLAGRALWLKTLSSLDSFSKNLIRINTALMGIIILALLSTFPRWWGLTVFLDALTLLVMGIIFTDFILVPQKHQG